MKKAGKGLAALAFFLLAFLTVSAEDRDGGPLPEEPVFPVIRRLDFRDTGFRQYMADVEQARRRLHLQDRTGESSAQIAESLTIYSYRPGEGETIFDIAGRCTVPYSAIASLNRAAHPAALEGTASVLLPSIPGIFVPEEAGSDMERLAAAARLSDTEGVPLTVYRDGRRENWRFFPGDDFSPTERIFFLNPGFRFPLRSYRLTSAYGLRRNPVTGNLRIHHGFDLAAPEGTEVYAAGDGIVTETGSDPVYGTYLVIKHGETWTSLYGHLSKIETTLQTPVRSGNLIGRVGSTGQSTGPHLQFELRKNDKALDPAKYLFRGTEERGMFRMQEEGN
ncbi:MAG: M23 family metallopeptidase [Treponema sp.]|jgi:murein DD-endopeptidase MepM/ murein hydrolase activator NlpD|nr:M23 family metallopeptidase [Treponema sp.]